MQIAVFQKLINESSDANSLREALRQSVKLLEGMDSERQLLAQEKEKYMFEKLQTQRELEEKLSNAESHLRRMNQNYSQQEQELQKQKKVALAEKKKAKDLFKQVDKLTMFMHGSHSHFRGEATKLSALLKKTLLNLGTRQPLSFAKEGVGLKHEGALDEELLGLPTLSLGTKRRLESMNEEREVPFDHKEFQILYDRLIQDLSEVRPWHNISVDMMLNQELAPAFEGTFSPPPEEIKLGMPDLSALEVKQSMRQSYANDSIHFNLDDLLKKETVETRASIEKINPVQSCE